MTTVEHALTIAAEQEARAEEDELYADYLKAERRLGRAFMLADEYPSVWQNLELHRALAAWRKARDAAGIPDVPVEPAVIRMTTSAAEYQVLK